MTKIVRLLVVIFGFIECENFCARKKLVPDLHKLQKKLENDYYSAFAAEINEAAANRNAEKMFRMSKNVIGGLKKAVVESKCTESQHIQYITDVFKDRKLDIPEELINLFKPVCVDNARAIDDRVPSLEEVKLIIKHKFKIRKAPGSDGIFNENLICALECPNFMDLLYKLVVQVWTEEDIPEAWRECLITLLYKKGKNDDPKNFRPLSLIHCVSKIITKIVRNRMSDRYEDIISGDQFGFRKGTGTIDAIYVFRQLIKCQKGPIFALFLDLRGAFDRLPRNIMFRILRIMLGNSKMANLLEAFHTRTTAKLKNGTEIFELMSSVRQGSDEGPNLFNIFFEYVLICCEEKLAKEYPDFGIDFSYNILSESDQNKRGHVSGPKYGIHKLLKMLYADDLIYYAKSAEALQKAVNIIKPIFDSFGLIIAEDKTKTMAFKLPKSESTPIITLPTLPEPTPLEHVDKFTYLGSKVSSENSAMFLNVQKESAWAAFNNHKKVLTLKSVNLKTRIDLLNSLVRSVLLYSSQATNLTLRQKQEIDALFRNFMRKMLNNWWKTAKIDEDGNYEAILTNEHLYKLTKQIPLENFIDKQFLKFQAHVSRLPNNHLQKKVQFIVPEVRISENIWSKCGKLMGGSKTKIDEIQVRKTFADKQKFHRDIDSLFGTSRAKKVKPRK